MINAAAFDGSSGKIEKLTFDMSGSHCTDGGGCVLNILGIGVDGNFAYDPLANGTWSLSLLGGFPGAPAFGFDFTGFDTRDVFEFTFLAGGATRGGTGATVAELAGTVITASVRFSATEVLTYSGTMAIVGHDVAANLVPVPEPETYAMLLAGLGLIGFVGYRRKQAV